MSALLSDAEVADKLSGLHGWRRERDEIVTEVRFPSYLAGIHFVNEVARVAEEANHHPDIMVSWRRVVIRLSTHSMGGITDKDFTVAAKIHQMIPNTAG